MSAFGHWFIKFSNSLVMPDPETPMIQSYKDSWEYKANLDCVLFWLIGHSFSSSSSVKICHEFCLSYNFNVIKFFSKHSVFDC